MSCTAWWKDRRRRRLRPLLVVETQVVATRTEAKKAPRQVELDHFVHPQNAAAMVQGKARSSSLATNANPMAQGSSAPSTGNVQAI